MATKTVSRTLIIGFVIAIGTSAADTDSRLAQAAHDGDMAAVRAMIADKADVSQPLGDGTTALHWAAQADDLEVADLLIRAGANVSARSRRGAMPLELASVNGSAAMIAKLLDAGADVNSSNAAGESMLMIASRTGNPSAVRLLIERGARVNEPNTAEKQTALMLAVAENHTDVVRVLLAASADVHARTAVEMPPATAGNLQGIGRAQNREKPVPQGGMTALLYAARDGRLESARLLVDAGAQVNQAEASGATPLLVAVLNGHIDVAALLLEREADMNAVDIFGRTALWAAVDLRNLDLPDGGNGASGVDRNAVLPLIKTLLDRGAAVNARTTREPPSRRWMMPFGARQWVNPAGQTPFVRAALAGDVMVLRLLLEHKADPSIPTLAGTTALMAAAGVGWVPRQTYTEKTDALVEAVKICIEHGADVNAADSSGYTALHGAAFRGSDAIVQLLAEKGARLDAKDKQGRTPSALADGTAYLAGPPEKRPSTLALLQKLSNGKGE